MTNSQTQTEGGKPKNKLSFRGAGKLVAANLKVKSMQTKLKKAMTNKAEANQRAEKTEKDMVEFIEKVEAQIQEVERTKSQLKQQELEIIIKKLERDLNTSLEWGVKFQKNRNILQKKLNKLRERE